MVTWISLLHRDYSEQNSLHLPKLSRKTSANKSPQHSVFVFISSHSLKSYNLRNRRLLLGTHIPLQSALHKSISANKTKRRSLLLVAAWAQVNCIKHIPPQKARNRLALPEFGVIFLYSHIL